MMGPDPGEIEVKMQRYYKSLSQKDGRIWAAIEALKVGYGGKHRSAACCYAITKRESWAWGNLRKKRWLSTRGFANPEVEGNQPLRGLPPEKRGFWECWSGTKRVHG
jgi:hypothetical protein